MYMHLMFNMQEKIIILHCNTADDRIQGMSILAHRFIPIFKITILAFQAVNDYSSSLTFTLYDVSSP